MKRLLMITTLLVVILAVIYNTVDINNAGLKVLSLIKKVQGKSVVLSNVDRSNSTYINHLSWDRLLDLYVDTDGGVDYDGFLLNKNELDYYLKALSLNPPKNDSSSDYKMAYWINCYNAFTIKLILDHYPIESIKDISDGVAMIDSPWDIKFFEIGGVDFDLNTIEHEILRKEFNDPRIHFAINCASFSCPKLLNQAYLPKQIDYQLERQAIDFINNSSKNKIEENTLKLSEIFSWFKVDFDKHGGVKLFLQKYVTFDVASASIEYVDYDWKLNNVSPK